MRHKAMPCFDTSSFAHRFQEIFIHMYCECECVRVCVCSKLFSCIILSGQGRGKQGSALESIEGKLGISELSTKGPILLMVEQEA